jgi:hypothetical protein
MSPPQTWQRGGPTYQPASGPGRPPARTYRIEDPHASGMAGALASPNCEIDATPLREAFLRSELTTGQLARALGWTMPDCGRVRRALGITGGPWLRYETAARIAPLLNLDPVDWE